MNANEYNAFDGWKTGTLRKLDAALHTEIRGQNPILPRVISVARRGELSLTKPARPRGSFLLLGPTGVGKTETVIVTTNQIFSPVQLFRFDMSEFQTRNHSDCCSGRDSAKRVIWGGTGTRRRRFAII